MTLARKVRDNPTPANHTPAGEAFRRLAEERLLSKPRAADHHHLEADSHRLVHELQVHQVELEMQNTELEAAREATEVLLEKYTDLYDFAPVGYFSLTSTGKIQLVNLTGAGLIGLERSRLIGRPLGLHVAASLQPALEAFLRKVFSSQARQSCDLVLTSAGRPLRTVNIAAECSPGRQLCRAVMTDISARRQTEAALRTSEIRYRRLFETAHDGVLLVDPGTRRITEANPFMSKLLGYPRDELVGKELYEIGLLHDEAASQAMFRKLKDEREVRYENLPLESKGGERREVEVVANLYEEDGRPVIQCNIRDITARIQAERALQLSEIRYHTLFNSMDEGFCVITMLFDRRGRPHDYRFLEINPSFEAQCGIHGAAGKRMREFTPEIEALWLEAYGDVALTGKPVRFAAEMKGLHRWFDVYAFRLGGPDSRNVAVLFRDITARKQAEEVRGQLVAIVESTSDAIIGKTLDGVIASWNTGAKRLFGYRPREIIGQPITTLIPPDLWSEESKMMARIRRGASTANLESVRLAKNGHRREVSLSLSPILDAKGAIIGASSIARDITERKQAEATKRRAEVLAFANQAANKEIGRRRAVEAALRESVLVQRELLIQSQDLHARIRHLAHQLLSVQEEERKAISRELHDSVLQTLVGINVELGVLGHGVGSPALLRKIGRTQQVVSRSIETVHRFARDLRPAVLDDFGLIPALRTFCESLAVQARFKVRLTASREIEALDLAERTVLFRVAQEALTNVARHAHASRVVIRIIRTDGVIHMEIGDNGRSFPVARVLRDKHPKRLGLVSMRERVEMVGGTLVIKSIHGKGTSVRVTIPPPGRRRP